MRFPAVLVPCPVVLALCLLASCATPVAPSGGPPDDLPPRVTETVPATEAVNVTAQSMRITFSEYVDEASFSQAFSITPSFSTRPEFIFDRRAVEVRFPEPLREQTTYVVTLDTELRDLHSVALSAPITLAFSTGPTISAGSIGGRVVTNGTGAPAAGIDILAYAVPDSAAPDTLPERPAYRTQTDQEGTFRFDYLTEQLYFVAALRDQNRNALPDLQEAFAPPPLVVIRADTTPAVVDIPWILTRVDTTRPEPRRVQSIASTRHILHMSEPVNFVDRDPEIWSLTDSSTGLPSNIETLYISAGDPEEVRFTTPPLPPAVYSLQPAALADTSGNPLLTNRISFTPSSNQDTVRLRFLSFFPEADSVLPYGIQPGVRFNTPIGREQLAAAVAVRDSSGTILGYEAITRNGTEYKIHPEPPLLPGGEILISVDGGRLAGTDSVFSRSFTRITHDATGEISGLVVSDAGPIVIQAVTLESPGDPMEYVTGADTSGAFVFRGLPEGTYRLRAFADADEDGMWDGGLLVPYRSPEGITWNNEPTRVRARWETSLPDTLHIPPP